MTDPDLILTNGTIAEAQRAINAVAAGQVQVVVTREVAYAEFVDDSNGGAVVDPFYTIPAGKVFVGIGIQVTEAFNDTYCVGAQVDVNIKVAGDFSTHSLADFNADALVTTGSAGGLTGLSNSDYVPFTNGSPLGISLTECELVLRLPAWIGDGTTGKCRVFIAWADPADAP